MAIDELLWSTKKALNKAYAKGPKWRGYILFTHKSLNNERNSKKDVHIYKRKTFTK